MPFFIPVLSPSFCLAGRPSLRAARRRAPIVSQVLDLNTLTWTAVGGTAVDGGSSVMYLPEILKVGTSVDPDLAATFGRHGLRPRSDAALSDVA